MAYCPNCGTQQPGGQRFCGVCGTAQPGTSGFTPMPAIPEVSTGDHNGQARVLVGLSLDPPRQSRWSVFFRLIMVFPLSFVAFGLEIAAFFVVIAAWFAALFTGRVPDGIQRFLTNVFRFYANLSAYLFLLTKRWPGIVWDGRPDDQLTLEVDHVRLRRWAVFFRIVLAIPAGIVNEVISIGSYPALFVMWCWGVIAGREPRALHQAMALVLRYQLRLFAYSCLLTPTQPLNGFFGDGEAPKPDPAQVVAVDSAALPTLATHWLVAKSAKNVFIVMLVLGIPLFYWQSHNNIHLVSQVKTLVAETTLTATYNSTVSVIDQFESTVGNCSANNELTCDANAARLALPVLTHQFYVIYDSSLFPSSNYQVVEYKTYLAQLGEDMRSIQTTTSLSHQENLINSAVPGAFTKFSEAYQSLYDWLRG